MRILFTRLPGVGLGSMSEQSETVLATQGHHGVPFLRS